jgi:hypothetical protein
MGSYVEHQVEHAPDFDAEFEGWRDEVQDEYLATIIALARFGPRLGRPRVDTLKGSAYPNMKELRFNVGGGVWRVAFAFDPRRRAVVLAGGDKRGVNEKRFYRNLIAKADARFAAHLAWLKAGTKE